MSLFASYAGDSLALMGLCLSVAVAGCCHRFLLPPRWRTAWVSEHCPPGRPMHHHPGTASAPYVPLVGRKRVNVLVGAMVAAVLYGRGTSSLGHLASVAAPYPFCPELTMLDGSCTCRTCYLFERKRKITSTLLFTVRSVVLTYEAADCDTHPCMYMSSQPGRDG